MSLKHLVDHYLASGHRTNPPLDPQAMLNDFLEQVQQQGQDLSEYDESEWRAVMPDFGIEDADLVIDALENLAGWGVVDNFVWESPVEQAVEDEIEK